MSIVKHISWLLANVWQPRIERSYESRDVHPLKTHRARRESPPPETAPDGIPESNEFLRHLTEARTPIRTYVDPRDIYLA